MGVCLYPVLEKEIAGIEYATDGKMLARIIDDSEKRAEILGIRPLMNFFGFDSEAIAEDFDIEPDETPTEKWFSAEDGLKTVEALIEDVEENQDAYFSTGGADRLMKELSAPILEGAIVDLKELRKVLQAASGENLKWYLAIDF